MKVKYRTLQLGMTLIEVFIVMAIIGILSAIAIPALSDHLIKSERARAQTDLYQLKIWAEQEYTSKGKYPSSDSGDACSNCDLSKKYDYSIASKGSGNNAYIIKAKPNETSIQKNDTKCYTMIINAASEKSNKNKDGSAGNNNGCWI